MVSPQQKQAAVGDLQKQGLSMRTSCTLVYGLRFRQLPVWQKVPGA